LVEEYNGEFNVFEIKTNPKKSLRVKKYPVFFEAYPGNELNVIHRDNWQDWLI
jgi:hypothetical protein